MGFFLKGLGDIATGQNEILPSFDAMIYAYLAQNAAGVCNNGQQFAATTTQGCNDCPWSKLCQWLLWHE